MSENAVEEKDSVLAEQPVSRSRLIWHTVLKYLGRLGILLLVAAVGIAGILYAMLYTACHGPSQATKELFATTMLETGALKWTAKLVMSKDEIAEVINSNAMEEMDVTMDDSLITIAAAEPEQSSPDSEEAEEFDINGVEIVKIPGRTFDATLMIVNDPSRIYCATTYPDWHRADLGQIVDSEDALGGINGGLYDQMTYTPLNVAVSKGQIVFNGGCYEGLCIIGFDEDNILRIVPTGNGSYGRIRDLVEEYHFRDAVAFPDMNGVNNAHFVSLVINGEPRETSGMGSGANPRTAIGQRADGSVLLLVTDGRGANGHLGATASDLIDIMIEYGAVNAANLDGGSSSAMYYEGEYLMTSTTLYYANSSYKLPTAFVIERR